jgi:hypothetical protein
LFFKGFSKMPRGGKRKGSGRKMGDGLQPGSVHTDIHPLEVEAFPLHLSAFDFPLIKNQTSF